MCPDSNESMAFRRGSGPCDYFATGCGGGQTDNPAGRSTPKLMSGTWSGGYEGPDGSRTLTWVTRQSDSTFTGRYSVAAITRMLHSQGQSLDRRTAATSA